MKDLHIDDTTDFQQKCYFQKILLKTAGSIPYVLPFTPNRLLLSRMDKQKSIFLFKGSDHLSLEENLCSIDSGPELSELKDFVIKFTIKYDLKEAAEKTLKNKGLSIASLFGSLDACGNYCAELFREINTALNYKK